MNNYPSRRLSVITQPASEPLTLSEVKTFLRIDHSNEDTLLNGLIAAVRQCAEAFMRKSILSQTWLLALDDAATSVTPLPMGPVQSITSVIAVNESEVGTTINSSTYHLTAAKDAVCFESTPISHRVEIRYIAGFGNAASDVPAAIRHGMLQHVAILYHHRETAGDLPDATRALYAPYAELRV